MGRSKRRHLEYAAEVYDSDEDAPKNSWCFRISVEHINVSPLPEAAVNEKAPLASAVDAGGL